MSKGSISKKEKSDALKRHKEKEKEEEVFRNTAIAATSWFRSIKNFLQPLHLLHGLSIVTQ
jgi:hypothetical protein